GGGAERQLAYLARELRLRGRDVLIAYIQEGLAPAEAADLPMRKLSSRRHRDPRLLAELIGVIRQWRPDVLQTWYVESDSEGSFSSLTFNIQHLTFNILVTPHVSPQKTPHSKPAAPRTFPPDPAPALRC